MGSSNVSSRAILAAIAAFTLACRGAPAPPDAGPPPRALARGEITAAFELFTRPMSGPGLSDAPFDEQRARVEQQLGPPHRATADGYEWWEPADAGVKDCAGLRLSRARGATEIITTCGQPDEPGLEIAPAQQLPSVAPPPSVSPDAYPKLPLGMTTCTAAEDRYAKERGPDVPEATRGRLKGALAGAVEAAYTTCKAPPKHGLHACIAVQNGSAVGVTVWSVPPLRPYTAPLTPLEKCIDKELRAVALPSNPRLDMITFP